MSSVHELCSDWHALYTVFIAPYPWAGKSVEVFFTSEHWFMGLRCATSSHTDECEVIYLCKYIQFKFTSRTLICTLNGIRSLRTGIMAEYSVMSTSQGTYVRIEQTSEELRETYKMCRVWGGGNYIPIHIHNFAYSRVIMNIKLSSHGFPNI